MINNIICGIDFSIRSPGICIKSNNVYNFLGLIRKNYKLNKKQIQIINEFSSNINNIETIWLDEHLTSKIYYEKEILNLKDALYLTNIIMQYLNKYITENTNLFVGIEGFSFGSKGNCLTELAGYQYILRNEIFKITKNIYIFSPKSVKLVAGKGNFDKKEVMNSFINSHENKDQINSLINTGWCHPFEDMVDAAWVVKTLEEKILKQKIN